MACSKSFLISQPRVRESHGDTGNTPAQEPLQHICLSWPHLIPRSHTLAHRLGVGFPTHELWGTLVIEGQAGTIAYKALSPYKTKPFWLLWHRIFQVWTLLRHNPVHFQVRSWICVTNTEWLFRVLTLQQSMCFAIYSAWLIIMASLVWLKMTSFLGFSLH